MDERDCGDAAVADEWHQRRGRPAHGLDVRRAEAGGGRLDDDLVAPTAQRGIVRAERPDLAMSIGHDRHLEVAGTREQRLDVEPGIAERCLRLGPGLLDHRHQLGLVIDPADPSPATAGGGLEHHGETQRGGRLDRVVDTVEGVAVPWHDP